MCQIGGATLTVCLAHRLSGLGHTSAPGLSCARQRGCAQVLISWLTNASYWELPHGDLPADPNFGNSRSVGADEQLQMRWGEEGLAEGWKGHILTACGLLHDYVWVGVCACQNLLILNLELDENVELVKPELRGRNKEPEVKLLDLMYVAANASLC